jgi:hypothetical protein
MTELHKRPHQHPKYKTAYRVKNWAEYDKALRDRGDITLPEYLPAETVEHVLASCDHATPIGARDRAELYSWHA